MIQEISINIKNDGLTHIIQLDTDMESNLPYILAEAFDEVIRLTSVNPNIVIEQLVAKYGLPESLKESDQKNNDYVTWHKPDVIPIINEPICVVFDDDSEKPFVINDIIDDNEWEHFVNDKKPKQWCYLNEVLKEGYKI
jgi:hypothetical protein